MVDLLGFVLGMTTASITIIVTLNLGWSFSRAGTLAMFNTVLVAVVYTLLVHGVPQKLIKGGITCWQH
jgi:hypothetical protein